MRQNYSAYGLDFARKAVSLAVNDNDVLASAAYAAERWGSQSQPAKELKAAGDVAGGGPASGQWGAELVSAEQSGVEFFEYVFPLTLLGQMPFRRVPAHKPIAVQTTAASGYFRASGAGRPASALGFSAVGFVELMANTAFSIFSNKLLRDLDLATEVYIRDSLAAVTVEGMDAALISSDAAVTDTSPAGLLHGATTIASTGVLADDIEAALYSYRGSMLTAAWITHPRLAATIGLKAGSDGAQNSVGVKGGVLAGIPLFTSEVIEEDSDGSSLLLVDCGGIAVSEGGTTVKSSQSAFIEANTTPTGNTITPTAASATRVSLFQENSTAIMAVTWAGWLACRSGAVIEISGANYL